MTEFRVAAVFSDNMVLRERREVRIFGDAEPGTRISCMLTVDSGNLDCVVAEGLTSAMENGRWILSMPAMEPGTGYRMTVSDGINTFLYDNVAFGEVFLAGGQSNMELELRNCAEWSSIRDVTEESKADGEVRFYYTQKRSYFTDEFFESEKNTAWACEGDEWWGAWSAVGYFFAKKLARELGMPVGIIGCNWGGTSASCWMSREDILKNEDTRIYVDEYDNSPHASKSEEEQIADYNDYLARQAEWDKKSGELYASVPGITWDEVQKRIGACEYPGPVNCASFLRPAGLYETMLKRIVPYTLSGVIYYQGESDDHRPNAYYQLFKNMIACWRREFADEKLPFLFVQLPMHRYAQDPDYKHWCLIREAQQRVGEDVPGTYMAVAIDQGEWNEIHPKSKRRVGERLAALALAGVYGKSDLHDAEAPAFRSCRRIEEGLEIEFDNVSSEKGRPFAVIPRQYGTEDTSSQYSNTRKLSEALKSAEIQGFEIAGEDGEYHEAAAKIVGDRIVLSSSDVAEPVSARYLWTNYSDVTLYALRKNMEPLPLAPFRM